MLRWLYESWFREAPRNKEILHQLVKVSVWVHRQIFKGGRWLPVMA